MTERTLTWQGLGEPPRLEQVRAQLRLGRLHARGTLLAGGPAPYRVDYELDTAEGYVTRRLLVRATGPGWSRELRLTRDAEGGWSARRLADPPDGADSLGDVPLLDPALDCTLDRSPLTHAMPVLRHRLHRRPGAHDLVTASVRLPTLAIARTGHHYRHLRRHPDGTATIRHRSGTATTDLTVDAAGFLLAHPHLAHRV